MTDAAALSAREEIGIEDHAVAVRTAPIESLLYAYGTRGQALALPIANP